MDAFTTRTQSLSGLSSPSPCSFRSISSEPSKLRRCCRCALVAAPPRGGGDVSAATPTAGRVNAMEPILHSSLAAYPRAASGPVSTPPFRIATCPLHT